MMCEKHVCLSGLHGVGNQRHGRPPSDIVNQAHCVCVDVSADLIVPYDAQSIWPQPSCEAVRHNVSTHAHGCDLRCKNGGPINVQARFCVCVSTMA